MKDLLIFIGGLATMGVLVLGYAAKALKDLNFGGRVK